ncbi:12648_t:CDS:2, partial [Acaulospora colombiana]
NWALTWINQVDADIPKAYGGCHRTRLTVDPLVFDCLSKTSEPKLWSTLSGLRVNDMMSDLECCNVQESGAWRGLSGRGGRDQDLICGLEHSISETGDPRNGKAYEPHTILR